MQAEPTILSLAELEEALQNIKNPNITIETMVLYIFGSKQHLDITKEQYSKLPQPLCAKSIPLGELSYKCYDCGQDNDYHIFCEQCFNDGKHTGHRYIRSLERGGCCDCGDQNAISEKGFCKKHCGFKGMSNITKEVNPDVKQKLEQVIVKIFDRLFTLCQKLNLQTGIFRDEEKQEYKQRMRELQDEITAVLRVISLFVESFCKDKLPLLFEVGNILLKQRTMTRTHNCGTDNFRDMFLKNCSPDIQAHECRTTITDLIYTHSLFMRDDKQQLTKIVYSLFMNPIFKKFLVEKYVERYKFSLVQKANSEVARSELGTLYTQFFSREQVTAFLNSPYIHYVSDILAEYYELLKTDKYEEAFAGVRCSLTIFQFMQQRIEALRLHLEGFNILNTLLKQSFLSTPTDSVITIQQKYRLYIDNMLLDLVCSCLGSFEYKTIEEQKLLAGLVILYFSESEKRHDDKQQYTYTDQAVGFQGQSFRPSQRFLSSKSVYTRVPLQAPHTYIFMWYTQPERMLGLILMTYVLKYGISEAKQLVEHCLTHSAYENIIIKLFKEYEFEERLSLSNYVGFLGQETPRDILKYYYRLPITHLYDCDQLCLQMLACLVNPDIFTRLFLDNVAPANQTNWLLQLVSEESFCLNSAAACKVINQPMIENVKKLYLINAMNFSKKQTYESIDKLFDKHILNTKNVKLEEILPSIAEFDRETGVFTIKPVYQGISERQYFQRNTAIYSKLHERIDEMKAVEFRKDNLLIYQMDKQMTSLSCLVTENMSKSVVFMSEVLGRYFRQLWNQTDKEQYIKNLKTNFKKLKIIQICLIRSIKDEKFLELIKGEYKYISDKVPTTQIHAILCEMLHSFNIVNTKTANIEEEDNHSNIDKAAKRKKQIFQQMKNKNQRFVAKNNILLIPENQEKNTEKAESLCLICHEKKAQEVVFTLRRTKIQTLPNKVYQSFSSCYHTFHIQCLAQIDGDMCPLCRMPFSLILFEIHHDYRFYSRIKEVPSFFQEVPNLKRTINITQFLSTLEAYLKSTNENASIDYAMIEEFIVSKVQHSIIQSTYMFCEKILPLLKTFMIIYSVIASRKYQEFTEIKNKLIQIALNQPQQEFIAYISKNKVAAFVTLVQIMLSVCLLKGSVATVEIYQKLIMRYFNAFLAANLISFGVRESLKSMPVEEVVRINKQAAFCQMSQFCRGVLYVYSIVFEQSYQAELSEMDKDTAGVVKIIEKCPELFPIDIKLLTKYLHFYPEISSKSLFSQESLLIQSKLIDLPETYMEFHNKYYNNKCGKCNDYSRVAKSQCQMCLICGYRACNINCTGDRHPTPQLSNHSKEHHCNVAVFVRYENTSIIINELFYGMTYGHLYENKFGESNPEKEKDWTKLLLDRAKVSKILSMLQKQTILEEIMSKLGNTRYSIMRV